MSFTNNGLPLDLADFSEVDLMIDDDPRIVFHCSSNDYSRDDVAIFGDHVVVRRSASRVAQVVPFSSIEERETLQGEDLTLLWLCTGELVEVRTLPRFEHIIRSTISRLFGPERRSAMSTS